MSAPVPMPGARPGASSPGDLGVIEARAAGGMLMALTLILLTLVVYLFSLSLPDEPRRRAVHASLAKAFYFPGADEEEAEAPKGPALLLSPGRDALRALGAHFGLVPEAGRVEWSEGDLVVRLAPERVFPAGGTAVADPAGTLGEVARLLARTHTQVRVEAPTLTGAVALTHALLGGGEGLRVARDRVSAVGAGLDPGVRVVLLRARGTL